MIFTISTGAGFFPSTVLLGFASSMFGLVPKILSQMVVNDGDESHGTIRKKISFLNKSKSYFRGCFPKKTKKIHRNPKSTTGCHPFLISVFDKNEAPVAGIGVVFIHQSPGSQWMSIFLLPPRCFARFLSKKETGGTFEKNLGNPGTKGWHLLVSYIKKKGPKGIRDDSKDLPRNICCILRAKKHSLVKKHEGCRKDFGKLCIFQLL